MTINKGFELREMCGEYIVIATGKENIDFSKVISLNESAAWLWNHVEGKEFTPKTLAALLMEEYEVVTAVIRSLIPKSATYPENDDIKEFSPSDDIMEFLPGGDNEE